MNIFADKASLVLRHLLRYPEKPWVISEIVESLGLSQGLVAKVILELRQQGFLKGEARGPKASSKLRHAEELLDQWTKQYQFNKNHTMAFYSSDKNILKILKNTLSPSKSVSYALTLHTGANFMTHYVRDQNVYAYLPAENFDNQVEELRKQLNLLELKQGGNVFFIKPWYRNSIFYNAQKIKGYSVVSNLQLYLDLFNYPDRGNEQALQLKRVLKEKGVPLA
ncbi:MAG TPA: type IV toxin-antitoxin system AbiEi family antitoxin [Oligoflexia bacterium]|nr:type IV toxin-antitoxin system AbiEi family antitoxin [Oligoflexia bacterium]HMR25354.1 type IV toxin-antitoxin system AbiEi family antitoxin [Oligoflexia bacterium]